MKIASYQFGITGNINKNFDVIKGAVEKAAKQKVDMIIFPECALTGYPGRDFKNTSDLDYSIVSAKINELKGLSDKLDIGIIVGTVFLDGKTFNRAYIIRPNKDLKWYDKRALYGWDEEHFSEGSKDGVFSFRGFNIGVRLCYEIRFPEYFRELYKAATNLNIILFNDVSEKDDTHRYRLIKSHLVTRAVENATPVLAVNSTKPFQTAPSCYVDASGNVLAQCKRNKEGMLVYEFEKKELTFGEEGRKKQSDSLLGL